MSQSAVTFSSRVRIHIGLAVSDAKRSASFYRTLLNIEPSKTRPGYARFEVDEPALNLSLIESSKPQVPDATTHYGIQVKSTDSVEAMRKKFEDAGLNTIVEESVDCCHAIQDKIWVIDPDGYRWEVFVVLDDTPALEQGHSGECCPTTSKDSEPCCVVEAEPCCSDNG